MIAKHKWARPNSNSPIKGPKGGIYKSTVIQLTEGRVAWLIERHYTFTFKRKYNTYLIYGYKT